MDYDKNTVLIILGCLIKKPTLFLNDKYKITEKDFAERFHKIVFGAIYNLFHSGVQTITPLEIDTYLSSYAIQKQIFDDNNGFEYIENLIKLAKLENFDFHYEILKKYTLLRELKCNGFDTSCYINDNIVDPKKTESMMERFNQMSINDILLDIEGKIVQVKDNFFQNENQVEQQAGKNLKNLIEELKLEPEMGLPMNSNIFNTICRGARRKKLYLKSCPSGYFKSRMSLADCAKVSIPYYFNKEENKWIHTGLNEPSLFITTELEVDEIQTMLLAYVACVNESHILDGRYEMCEEERVKKAAEYIEQSKMFIVQIPNFSIDDIERTIRKYQIVNQVTYVYFDYIFTSIHMLAELSSQSKGMKLREDNVLLMFITKLKDLCNELDIHISTATQVSDGWQVGKTPDSSLIKSCKALADKADIAYIGLPPSKEDLELLQPILIKGMYETPNLCYHIYKVRRGSYNKIRLYLKFDGGTCRTKELFVTDNDCHLLNISGTNIEKVLDSTATEIQELTEEEKAQFENGEVTTDD